VTPAAARRTSGWAAYPPAAAAAAYRHSENRSHVCAIILTTGRLSKTETQTVWLAKRQYHALVAYIICLAENIINAVKLCVKLSNVKTLESGGSENRAPVSAWLVKGGWRRRNRYYDINGENKYQWLMTRETGYQRGDIIERNGEGSNDEKNEKITWRR